VEAETAGARRVKFLDRFLVQNFVAVESEEKEESRTQDFRTLVREVRQSELFLLVQNFEERLLANGRGEGDARFDSPGYLT
jgi:hypothetical protein